MWARSRYSVYLCYSYKSANADAKKGAWQMRAAVQQTHFTSLLAEAERALKEHCKAQGVRVKVRLLLNLNAFTYASY